MLIKSDHAANGPHGLSWSKPGATQDVKDEKVARHLLKIEGFSEVKDDGHAESFSEVEEVEPEVQETPAPRRNRKTSGDTTPRSRQ